MYKPYLRALYVWCFYMLTSPCYVDSFFHFCHSFNLSPSSFHAISSSAPLEKTALSIVDYRPTKIAPSSFVMPARLLLFLHRSPYECNPSRLRFPTSHPTWEGPRQTRLIFRQFSEASWLERYLYALKKQQSPLLHSYLWRPCQLQRRLAKDSFTNDYRKSFLRPSP